MLWCRRVLVLPRCFVWQWLTVSGGELLWGPAGWWWDRSQAPAWPNSMHHHPAVFLSKHAGGLWFGVRQPAYCLLRSTCVHSMFCASVAPDKIKRVLLPTLPTMELCGGLLC